MVRENQYTPLELLDSIDIEEFHKDTWQSILKTPPSARNVIATNKFKEYVGKIDASGVIPGRLTIAIYNSEKYLVDGWHRMFAFHQTSRQSALAEVKYVQCKTAESMCRLFTDINEPIRSVSVSDKLRNIYGYNPDFKRLVDKRKYLTFSGKKMGIMISVLLYAWFASKRESPFKASGKLISLVEKMTREEFEVFGDLIDEIHEAWDYRKPVLWRGLNMASVFWMLRQMNVSKSDRRKILEAIDQDDSYTDMISGKGSNNVDNGAMAYDALTKIVRRAVPHDQDGKPIDIPKRLWMTNAERVDFNRKVELQAAIEKKRNTGKRDLRAHQKRKPRPSDVNWNVTGGKLIKRHT